MHRRKFIVGASSITAGLTAAVGTVAFDSVAATRAVAVDVAADSQALVGLEPVNETYVSETATGTIELSFGDDDVGLNPSAITTFMDLIKVHNQGSDPIETLSFAIEPTDHSISQAIFVVSPDDITADRVPTDRANVLDAPLPADESITIGLRFDLTTIDEPTAGEEFDLTLVTTATSR